MTGVSRSVAIGLLALTAVLTLTGCRGADPEPEHTKDTAADALPELARIGGVVDVWPFEFGLNASRDAVRDALGDPVDVEESAPRQSVVGSRVEVWSYHGVALTFLVEEGRNEEYLLSARVSEPAPPLRGGLAIGMRVGEARELLGEPRVADETRLVYFYRDTTIELELGDGVVRSVTLARALP